MTQNGVGQQNQRSFGRFLICMVIWAIILTQCGTYWIYEFIDNIVNLEEPELEEETTKYQIPKPKISSEGTHLIFLIFQDENVKIKDENVKITNPFKWARL